MSEKDFRKKQIVLLTDCLAGFEGGSERQIFELAKRLDKAKYQITITSLECEGAAPEEPVRAIACDLKIFRVKRIYGLSGLREGWRFYHFLRKQKVDILMTYHFSSDIWGTVWARAAGVPTIISNRRDMGFWRNQWHCQAYRFINRWVSKMIVVAVSVKQKIMLDENIPSEKIEVIYNGVDVPAEHPPGRKSAIRIQLGLSDDTRVIMHVANLKPVKGHIYLLRAFAEIVRKFPKTVLVLVGEDELNGTLERLVQKLRKRCKIYYKKILKLLLLQFQLLKNQF